MGNFSNFFSSWDLHTVNYPRNTQANPKTSHFSMDKSRKLGWHGFVDSTESFFEVFRDLARIKMIPPVPKN